jgi:hypothetical protein
MKKPENHFSGTALMWPVDPAGLIGVRRQNCHRKKIKIQKTNIGPHPNMTRSILLG